MQFSKRSKPKQELMTLLEPRRLMSLTGGVDYTPVLDAAPTQITHSFGYEHMLVNNGGGVRVPMTMDTNFGSHSFDFSGFEAQFARAVAQGSPISFADPNAGSAIMTGDAPIHAPHVDAFVSMYTSLSNSTVISIDNANAEMPTATSITLSAANDTTFHASVSDESTASPAADISTANSGLATPTINAPATEPANKIASINATIAPAVTLPAAVLTSASGPIASTDELPHGTLQAIEQEFLTVSTLAREMISQLGRDIAIELSHLESDLNFGSLDEQFTTHLDGWRSVAAATGAAIATIVYIQSEADREKNKVTPMFSSTLIEVVRS